MRSSLCWPVILLCALAYPAFPAIRPSFHLDHSAWHATHIVLATTTTGNETFEVVESWKGDLHAGDRLVIPELRPPADAEPISAYPKSSEPTLCNPGTELVPKQPVGSRIILFLVSSADQAPTNSADKIQLGRWKPSDLLDSIQASVVWIDGGYLYAFEQVVNPGLPILCKLPYSETLVRNRVAEINETQAQIAVVVSLQDAEERAERLRPYVGSDVFPVRQVALKELGKAGAPAVPVISGMLDDPAFADQVPFLVDALADAGGEAAGKELNKRLRHELAFWKSKGPSLRRGWIDEDTDIHAPLKERYSVIYELILGLEKTRYAGALRTVVELRDVWRSLPQLNDGFEEFEQECDKLIGILKTASANR